MPSPAMALAEAMVRWHGPRRRRSGAMRALFGIHVLVVGAALAASLGSLVRHR